MMLIDCTEIKLYLYLMSKLCIPMESCTFLSFYCKYVKKRKMKPPNLVYTHQHWLKK